MGLIYELFTQREAMDANAERMLELAMSIMSADDLVRTKFAAALGLLVNKPRTNLSLTNAELERLGEILRQLNERGEMKRGEAFLVSLMRLRRETGWDLLTDPRIYRFARKGARAYLDYMSALGVLALAWQVKKYDSVGDVMLSYDAEFQYRYPPAIKPRSA